MRAGLDGGAVAPFDSADPGCRRSRASFLAVPSEHFLPTPTAGDRHAIDSRPPVFPWVLIALGAIPNRLSRSVQLAAKRAGMRSGGLLPPPAPRSRPSAAVDHLGRDPAQLLPPPDPPVVSKTTESAGPTTESGLLRPQGGFCSPNGPGIALLGHWRGQGLLRASQGPRAKSWLLDL